MEGAAKGYVLPWKFRLSLCRSGSESESNPVCANYTAECFTRLTALSALAANQCLAVLVPARPHIHAGESLSRIYL